MLTNKSKALLLTLTVISTSAMSMSMSEFHSNESKYKPSIHNSNVQNPEVPNSLGQNASADKNSMGRWARLGNLVSVLSSGEYTTILAPSAVGKICLKGEKGFVSATKQVASDCHHWTCSGSTDTVLDTSRGYKAVCR